MPNTLKLSLSPNEALVEENLQAFLRKKLRLVSQDSLEMRLQRRSIDARKAKIKVNLELEYSVNEVLNERELLDYTHHFVGTAKPVIVIGAGPAGLFAALRLIELGLKPIVIERGKNVRERRRDLAAINKEHKVNPESNYCFGEGGAGTYSDGKLYTRSKKRGSIRRILELLYLHGAKEEILVDAHPHIGTNKLPQLVQRLREAILEYGGEVHFNTRVDDLILEGDRLKGVVDQHGHKHLGEACILATGHSARDIYELLHRRGILIEAKPFAMGVRIEHPQEIIDKVQYHGQDRGELPAAAYSLAYQTFVKGKQRGVFSFCMCPGGFIVPAATAQEEVVVNGMSPSKRNSRFANSGMVVAILEEDLKPFANKGPLAGLAMQQQLERKCWTMGGKTQSAPAQRMLDFMAGTASKSLNECSYIPGLTPVDMNELLPRSFSLRMKQAFKGFRKQMPAYYTNEANLVGVESRTSAPVRIPRDKLTMEHPQIEGLYPCAEGAGYAGGIVSAAMDGERCAEAIAVKIKA